MIEIVNKEQCCGCSACCSICPKQAITMKADDEGFLYPSINLNKCVNCHLCENVCPIIFRDGLKKSLKPQKYLAGRLNNYEELMACSSGGAFWALAKDVIARNGIVVGAIYSDDMRVIHSFAETIEQCKKFRGSKYSQSDVIGVFPKVKMLLQSGKIVLFSGNPCQVEGLKRYLLKPYENLFTVDLVCHAVPSPKFFKEYCEYVSGVFRKRLVAINMRDKIAHGWSHKYSYRYLFVDGSSEVDSVRVSNWGRLFFSQYINRPSCHSCRFSNLQRSGDITIADFWDDARNREDVRNSKGTSLILLNSEKGVHFFEKVRKSMEVFEISEKEAMQPSLIGPTPKNPKREEFWEFYHRYGFVKTYKKYFQDSLYTRGKRFIKKCMLKCFS